MSCALFCLGGGVAVGGGGGLFWWNVWVVPRKVSRLPLAKPSVPLRCGTTAWPGGGGLHATHYYHMHTSMGCLGAWGYRGRYAIIAISCLCQEESLKCLKD